MLPGLFGRAVCTMHCRSICPVPFPSCLITTHTSTTAVIANKLTDCTSSPRYRIMLSLLLYSLKLWAQCPIRLNSIQLKWLSCVKLSRVVAVIVPYYSTQSALRAPIHTTTPIQHTCCKQKRSVMRQRMEAVVSFARGEVDSWWGVGGVANSWCIHAGSTWWGDI